LSKPKNQLETVKLGITTSKRVADFLDQLVKTEIFGRSKAEVAEQLIKRAMEDFLMNDKIEKLNKRL
jgi:tartrate dehydratase beta subunit/fumarate hydratase class I family protein